MTTHILCAVATTPSLALFEGVCVDRSSYSGHPNTTLTFLQPHPKITHTHWCRGRWTWNRWLKICSRSVSVATVSKERHCHNSVQQLHTNTLNKHTHRNLHVIRSLVVLFVDKLKEIFIALLHTVKHTQQKKWNFTNFAWTPLDLWNIYIKLMQRFYMKFTIFTLLINQLKPFLFIVTSKNALIMLYHKDTAK